MFLTSSSVSEASFIPVLQSSKYFSNPPCSLGILDARLGPMFVKYLLKLVSAIFYQIFIFSPNDSPLKTMKNVFYFI